MKVRLSLLIAAYAVMAFGCTKTGPVVVTEKNTMTVTSDVVTESFVGNGPQWGGYDVLNYLIGRNTLSEEDWNTLFERVSFMSPGPVLDIQARRGRD